jgi:hypothetical protein
MLRSTLVSRTPENVLMACWVVATYSSRLSRVARPAMVLAAVETTSMYSTSNRPANACAIGVDAWPPQLIRLMLRSVGACVPVTVGTTICPTLLGVRSISSVSSGWSSRQCSTCAAALVASNTTSNGRGAARTASIPPAVVA